MNNGKAEALLLRLATQKPCLLSFLAVSSHRLNLFYVANDVIQNCKRKNAIVYRTAFAEVLRDACLLVK